LDGITIAPKQFAESPESIIEGVKIVVGFVQTDHGTCSSPIGWVFNIRSIGFIRDLSRGATHQNGHEHQYEQRSHHEAALLSQKLTYALTILDRRFMKKFHLIIFRDSRLLIKMMLV
jgi:hypothetical protein